MNIYINIIFLWYHYKFNKEDKIMKTMFRFFKGYPGVIKWSILFLLLSVFSFIADSGQTFISRQLFNNITDKNQVILYTSLILGMYVVFGGTFVIQRMIKVNIESKTVNAIIESIHRKVLHGDAKVVDNTKYSDIISAVECTEGLYSNAIGSIDYTLWLIVSYISGVIFMWLINPTITIICIIISLLVGLIYFTVQKKYDEFSKEIIECRSRRWDIINRLSSYRVIKNIIREKYEEQQLKERHNHFCNIFTKQTQCGCWLEVIMQATYFVVDGTIIVMSIYYIYDKKMTIVDALALYQLSSNLLRPMKQFSNVLEEKAKMVANIKKIETVLAIPQECDGDIELKEFRNSIDFRGLNFEYNDSHHVLRDINLSIKKGESVGIYGPSGEGKSTIIKLLTKLHTSRDGQLFVDDLDINMIDNKSLRSKIGVVTQEVQLFSDINIMENIRYGDLNASDKDVMKAAKLACIHETIKGFPDGYKSMIGNNGVKLSGGEKQRISIARTILQNPDILILDEATSGLDNISEKAVKSAIDELTKGKTVISIAHRITTIKSCDRLVGIKNHRIVEEGTYEELMKDKSSLLYELEQSTK